jgi:hypothetical protein
LQYEDDNAARTMKRWNEGGNGMKRKKEATERKK